MSDILDGLNPEQREAAEYTGSTLMVVAGAGSGKTRLLTHRIANILANKKAFPSQILAITFTNKASREMRDRLDKMLEGDDTRSLWVATFHACCVRILRKWHKELGLASSFTIYDTDDAKRLLKTICDEMNLDPKQFPPKMFLGKISDLKNELTTPAEFAEFAETSGETMDELVAKVYRIYQQRLENLEALDFDDLIGRTIRLLKRNAEVRAFYNRKFKYILVDEYQDTNKAQYILIRLLAGYDVPGIKKDESDNAVPTLPASLTVVGDSDQSIYAFRGATIRNILEFEKDFPNAHVVLLEQNYRSVNNILKAANAVIDENPDRKKKHLWSEKGDGAVLQGYEASDGYDEADFIVREIEHLTREEGQSYADIAIFFRTNSQSRAIEEKFVRAGIPYKLVGGTKFYDRKEIRDVTAYLHAIINRDDDIHLRRILNLPRRGIGKASEDRVAQFASDHGCSFGTCLEMLDEIVEINAGARAKLQDFADLMTSLELWIDTANPELGELVQEVVTKTGLLEELKLSTDPADQVRVDNVEEFISAAATFVPQQLGDDEDTDPEVLAMITSGKALGRKGLELFLEQISLSADSDQIPENDPLSLEYTGQVVMMTIHTAKGLEFDNVFITGFEDGGLPHTNSFGDEFQLTEERRLAYVAITRARERLYLTWAASRNIFGKWQNFSGSRFLKSIPDELISWDESYSDSSSGYQSSYQNNYQSNYQRGYNKSYPSRSKRQIEDDLDWIA